MIWLIVTTINHYTIKSKHHMTNMHYFHLILIFFNLSANWHHIRGVPPNIIYNSRLNFICFSRLRDATSHHVFKPFFSATRLFLDKSIMGLGSDKKEPDISIRRLGRSHELYSQLPLLLKKLMAIISNLVSL